MSRNEFIQACLKNDKAARHQLIEQHYGFLMGMCRRYAKSNEQAETFFAQAFMDIFKHLPEYNDNEDLNEWIKKTFLVSLIFQLKSDRTAYYVTTTARMDEKKKVHTDLFHQEEEEDPNKLSVEDYINALQKMPCSFRAVYNLRVIENMELPEACRLLEISVESAKNTLERARFEFS
ncbi:MAG TPA: sigma-70 family RNA polymerase sigma factor, partial [Bacteroidia bacterium]